MVRERMIEAAVLLFRKQGYAETSWRELVQEAGTPWGSAYHYFPGGKEELAREALDFYATRFREEFEAICAAHTAPADRVLAWFAGAAEHMNETSFALGCPLAGISLNTVPKSAALSELCKNGFELWLNYLGEKLACTRQTALAVLSGFEGALVLARSLRSTEPFIAAGGYLAKLISSQER